MMLEGTNQSAAIGWVREDLDERLDSIRKNLEAFAEDPSQNGALTTVQQELERLQVGEADVEKVEQQLEQARQQYLDQAKALSKSRSQTAASLSDRISRRIKSQDKIQ